MTTALERLQSGYYNSAPVSGANPGGLGGDGHVVNFPAALDDIAAAVSEILVDAEAIAGAGPAAAAAAAASAEAQAAQEGAVEAADQAGAARNAAVDAQGAAEAAAGVAEEEAATAVAAAQAVVDIAEQVAAAVGAAEAARDAAQGAVAPAEAARDAAQAVVEPVEAARDEAQAAQAAAEAARDAALTADPADFARKSQNLSDLADKAAARTNLSVHSKAEADARFRKVADALVIGDIDGLTSALGGKATPADIDAAIAAVVGMAPTELDTLKEVADKLAEQDDSYAALVAVIADKASQADLTALAALVLAKATVAQVRAGSADDVVVTPKTLADADAYVPVTATGAVTLDFSAGRKFTLTMTGNVTLSVTGLGKDISGVIRFKQDGTGSRTLALHSSIKKVGAYTLSTPANTVDRCGVEICDGVAEFTALEKGVS